MEPDQPALSIAPELLEKLNRQLILEDDLRACIQYCEASGNKIFDPQKNCYIGHQKQQVMTYWVFYRVEGDAYRVINAYCHRLHIEGE
jgi:hypothetical protein